MKNMPSMTEPEVYKTVKKWLIDLEAGSSSLDFAKSSTKRGGLHWLKKYCRHLKTNPDDLIRERTAQLESTNPAIKMEHEDHLKSFIVSLKREGKAPNTIATAVGMVRSFYRANNVPLGKVRSVKIRKVRPFKVPTPKDLNKMCKVADIPTRAWICCQKDSGLGNAELISLRLSTLSSEYGTIKRQLKRGIVPIHVEIRRQKTGERTDSFFGPNAIEALNQYVNLKSRGRIFRMSIRSVQQKVKATAIRAKVATKEVPVTPHKLRTFFNTQMKFVAQMNEALVERMMGHSIGRVKSAYLVTGRDETMSGIPISKLAEEYMKHYYAIDITKV